ncbi:hypothetical protein PCCS19_53750 [Paenibacillus sp. CCS19]|nr:hypothetical protein PCCS19_53750 [Paenibacillus cellulosilyticus]
MNTILHYSTKPTTKRKSFAMWEFIGLLQMGSVGMALDVALPLLFRADGGLRIFKCGVTTLN